MAPKFRGACEGLYRGLVKEIMHSLLGPCVLCTEMMDLCWRTGTDCLFPRAVPVFLNENIPMMTQRDKNTRINIKLPGIIYWAFNNLE